MPAECFQRVADAGIIKGVARSSADAPRTKGDAMSIWDDAPKNSRAVYDRLTLLAKRMRVETYGEIAAAIGQAENREIAPVSLRYPLGFIRDRICRPQGLPWLNALAVSADDWYPGDSFLPPGVAFGDGEEILWRGAVLAVFAYPWDKVDLG